MSIDNAHMNNIPNLDLPNAKSIKNFQGKIELNLSALFSEVELINFSTKIINTSIFFNQMQLDFLI